MAPGNAAEPSTPRSDHNSAFDTVLCLVLFPSDAISLIDRMSRVFDLDTAQFCSEASNSAQVTVRRFFYLPVSA